MPGASSPLQVRPPQGSKYSILRTKYYTGYLCELIDSFTYPFLNMNALKRNVFLLICALTLSFAAQAVKLPGQIYRDGVIEDVTLRVKTNLLGDLQLITMQYKIIYFDKKGNKHKLRPGEADEIHFDFKGEHVRMICVDNNLYSGSIFRGNGRKIFLRNFIEGPLSLFEFYYESQTMAGPNGQMVRNIHVDYVLKKYDGPLFIPVHIGFRKSMLQFLDDCPAVVEKLQDRELRRRNLETMVKYYNEQCGEE